MYTQRHSYCKSEEIYHALSSPHFSLLAVLRLSVILHKLPPNNWYVTCSVICAILPNRIRRKGPSKNSELGSTGVTASVSHFHEEHSKFISANCNKISEKQRIYNRPTLLSTWPGLSMYMIWYLLIKFESIKEPSFHKSITFRFYFINTAIKYYACVLLVRMSYNLSTTGTQMQISVNVWTAIFVTWNSELVTCSDPLNFKW